MIADFRKGLLGPRAAEIMCVEWQKRGLPHAHMLLFFQGEFKLRDPIDFDQVVSAEIPDPINEPILHQRVLRFMIHGPCSQMILSKMDHRHSFHLLKMWLREHKKETNRLFDPRNKVFVQGLMLS